MASPPMRPRGSRASCGSRLQRRADGDVSRTGSAAECRRYRRRTECPFVFQHGLGGDAGQTAEVFPANSGRRLITLECRGHGRSEAGPEAAFSLAQFSDDLGSLIESTLTGPVNIGGISMGAAITLMLAVRKPQLVKSPGHRAARLGPRYRAAQHATQRRRRRIAVPARPGHRAPRCSTAVPRRRSSNATAPTTSPPCAASSRGPIRRSWRRSSPASPRMARG